MNAAASGRAVLLALLTVSSLSSFGVLGCNAIFGLDPPRLAVALDAAADAAVDGSVIDGSRSSADRPTDLGASPAPADAGDAGVSPPTPSSDGGPCTSGCRGTAGPTPVNIEQLFCIDSTEVTNRQYADFLAAASPADIQQPATCLWNDSFYPSPAAWPYPAGADQVPVIAVDFCDAWSYCHWAGKRLCGRVGHTTATFDDVLNGEMYYACSGGLGQSYPYSYGATYDANKCDTDMFRLENVKSNPQCVSAVFANLYDLSGSLAVWEDMCLPADIRPDAGPPDGSLDACRLSTPFYSDHTCGALNYLQRNYLSGTTGLRCCSDVCSP